MRHSTAELGSSGDGPARDPAAGHLPLSPRISGLRPRLRQGSGSNESGLESGLESGPQALTLVDSSTSGAPDPGSAAGWSDPRRVERLVSEHSKYIYRLLRRFGVRESALDDATQEVFIIAARKLDAVVEGKERSFLCGTAFRVASNSRRARGREASRLSDACPEELQCVAPTNESLFEQKQARALLDRILDAMTDELRTVFVLCELQGLTAVETAEIVDAPLGTVASRLRRSREQFHEHAARLREVLGSEGGPVEPAQPVSSKTKATRWPGLASRGSR